MAARIRKSRGETNYDWVASRLAYNPLTGAFIWIKQCGPKLQGMKAGSISQHPYLTIGLGGRLYYAHRIAWLLTHGAWPTNQIDHINGNGLDNRLANLRECSNAENCQNLGLRKSNTSGFTGVSWSNERQRWQVHIRENGKSKALGRFLNREDAESAYLSAKQTVHPFEPIPRELRT